MSPRDRVLAILSHKRADRIPYEFSFTPSLMETFKQRCGSEDVVEYFDFDMRSVYIAPTRLKTDFSRYLDGLKEGKLSQRPGKSGLIFMSGIIVMEI